MEGKVVIGTDWMITNFEKVFFIWYVALTDQRLNYPGELSKNECKALLEIIFAVITKKFVSVRIYCTKKKILRPHVETINQSSFVRRSSYKV